MQLTHLLAPCQSQQVCSPGEKLEGVQVLVGGSGWLEARPLWCGCREPRPLPAVLS